MTIADNLRNDLKALKALEPDWGGEEEAPPSELSLSLAQKALELLLDAKLPPIDISADVEGGVGFNWWYDNLWLAFSNKGDVSLVGEGIKPRGFDQALTGLVEAVREVVSPSLVISVGVKVKLNPKSCKPFDMDVSGRGVGEVFAVEGTAISHNGTRYLLQEGEVGVRWEAGDLSVMDEVFLESA